MTVAVGRFSELLFFRSKTIFDCIVLSGSLQNLNPDIKTRQSDCLLDPRCSMIYSWSRAMVRKRTSTVTGNKDEPTLLIPGSR